MKGTSKIPGTFAGDFIVDSVVQVIILVHSLRKENREFMAQVNLGQTSHVSENYTSQLYQNAQANQDLKVLFTLSKKRAIPKNWITKLEIKVWWKVEEYK